MPVVQLHIPKTGGSALRHALKPTGAYRWGHSQVLDLERRAEMDLRFIVTLRDPVARFVSAFVWQRDRLGHRGYADADALALSLRGSFQKIRDLVVFKPQIEWVHSVERLREPDILAVLFTDTLDADLAALKERMGWGDEVQLPGHGHPRRNEQEYDDVLSPEGEALVREHYADDILLVDTMRGVG